MFCIPPAIERSDDLMLLWSACVSPKKLSKQQIIQTDISRLIVIIENQDNISMIAIGNLLFGISQIMFRRTQLWVKDIERAQENMNQLFLFADRFSDPKKKRKSVKKDESLILKDCDITFGVTDEDFKMLKQISKGSINDAPAAIPRMNNITMVDVPSMQDPIDIVSPIFDDGFGGEIDIVSPIFDDGFGGEIEIEDNFFDSVIEEHNSPESVRHSEGVENNPETFRGSSPPGPNNDHYDDDFFADSMDFQYDPQAGDTSHNSQLLPRENAMILETISSDVAKQQEKKTPKKKKSLEKRKLVFDFPIEILKEDLRAGVENLTSSCYHFVEFPYDYKSPPQSVETLFHEPLRQIQSSQLVQLFDPTGESRKISRRRVSLDDGASSPESSGSDENVRGNISPIINPSPPSFPSPSMDAPDDDGFGFDNDPHPSPPPQPIDQRGPVIRSKPVVHENLDSPEFALVVDQFRDSQVNFTFLEDLIHHTWGASKIIQFFGRMLQNTEYIMEQEQSFHSFNPILVLRASA